MIASTLLVVVAFAFGIGLWRRGEGRSEVERALAATLPPAAAVASLLVLGRVLEAPWRMWDGIRLAPSASILRGLGLPSTSSDGAILGHLYGPVSPLYFVPAALLPTPTASLIAASALAVLAVVGPLAWMLRMEAGGNRVAALAPLVAFVLYAGASDVLGAVTFSVHADAPALGLAALACALVIRTGIMNDRRLAVGALMAVLAVFAKQPAAPVLVAVPIYLAARDGRRTALRYTTAAVVIGIALIAIAVVVPRSGLLGMTRDAAAVADGMSWKQGGSLPAALVQSARDLIPRAAPFATILLVYGVLAWRGRDDRASLRRWLAGNEWTLPAFVAVACVPTSLLGRAVEGASMNGLAYSVYFAAVASLLVICRILRAGTQAPAPALADGIRAAAVVILLTLATTHARVLWETPSRVAALHANPNAQAMRFAVEHPGEAYFPYHPLVGLKAEGSLYHVLMPVTTRVAMRELLESEDGAGLRRAMRRHMPPSVRYMLVPADMHPLMARRFEAVRRDVLPDFATRAVLDEMAGWTAFTEGR